MNEIKKRIILVIFGIVLGVLFIEILLVIFDKPHFYRRHSAPAQFAFLNKDDKDIIYFNIPSQRIRFIFDGNPRGYFGKDNEIDHITNSWGFRGKDFSIYKPENTFRIAFLGDSFTFGEGVRFSDTYPELVSFILEQKYKSPSVHFESYNFGVGGYNTSQSLYILRNITLQTNPDVLVLGYTLNDAEPPLFELDRMTRRISRRPREYYIPEGLGDPLPPDRPLYKLRLFRLLWQLAQNRRQTEKTIAYYKSLFLETNDGWIESRRALHEIIGLCAQRNIPCYVLLFPILYQLNDKYPFTHIHHIIRKEVERRGVFFIDLFNFLKGSDAKKLWVHPADQHPNEKVHEIAAKAIAGEIISNKDINRKINDMIYGK